MITATEYAFDVPSSTKAGPTKVTLTNLGREGHNALILKLNKDARFDDVVRVLTGPATRGGTSAISKLAGGFANVSPGASAFIGLRLDPGTYVFVCFTRHADGDPHFARGMMAPIEVSGPASKDELPLGDASVTQTEFKFDGLHSLRPGTHTISVANKGEQPHEAIIFRLPTGVTAENVREAIASGEASGIPQLTLIAGTAAQEPGSTMNLHVDLPKGEYVFICTWTDHTKSKLHAALGMVSGLSVK